jgi:hypothetical protein
MSIYSKLLTTAGVFSMTAAMLSIVPVSGLVEITIPTNQNKTSCNSINQNQTGDVNTVETIDNLNVNCDNTDFASSGSPSISNSFMSSLSSSVSKTIVSDDVLYTDGPNGNLGLKKIKKF